MRLTLLPILLVLATPALADTAQARCSFTPKGQKTEAEIRPCVFSQRQGYVTIRFADEDDFVADLSPTEGAGNYLDQNGDPAYRKRLAGHDGHVYDLTTGRIKVYWGQ
jgi:hypothetical protein